jgi:LuxR family transcriptional regulator, maltose regulon positive regulatory protein
MKTPQSEQTPPAAHPAHTTAAHGRNHRATQVRTRLRSAPTSPSLPAKLSRPQAGGLLPRTRIFRQLGADTTIRWTWIAAPAGSGKTSLASGWVEHSERQCLWYQLDAGDADPGTFFHYLTLAALDRACGQSVHLPPPLTPEFLPGLDLYTRRFFEKLFALYEEPFVFVLDNYHETPPQAPLTSIVLSALLESLPQHGKLLCLSRQSVPQTLIRHSSHPGFQELRAEDLSLTDDEAVQFSALVNPGAAADAIQCSRRVHGWVMGVKLLLRARPEELKQPGPGPTHTSKGLFDYFASEVFADIPGSLREFLLRASVLDEMNGPTVRELTEHEDAQLVLEQLYADRLFIERRMLRGRPSYQFHPLFRAYLRERLALCTSRVQISEIQARAVNSLVEGGQLELATALAVEGKVPGVLVRLIRAQAPQLVADGRLATLERWLLEIPERELQSDGWLMYWLGLASSVRDPALGRRWLERAYSQFSDTNDSAGSWLSVASIMHNHFLSWGTHPEELWKWVDTFESLRAAHGGSIPEPLEIQIMSLLAVMAGHCPEHPLSRHLARRARELALHLTDAEERRGIGAIAIGQLAWEGDEITAWSLIDELGAMQINPARVSLATLSFDSWQGILLWTASDHERAFAHLSAARERCCSAGLGIFEYEFLVHLILTALSAGDLPRADSLLQQAMRTAQPCHVHMRQVLRAVRAIYLALSGHTAAGAALAREVLGETGMVAAPSSAAFTRSFLTAALLEDGLHDEAEQSGLAMLELAAKLPSDRWLFEAQMLLAGVELERGAEAKAVERLREALSIARRRNFRGGVSLWQGERAARLLHLALRQEIEVAYVRALIRHRQLTTPAETDVRGIWPVRLRVAMLGQFSLWMEDQPQASRRTLARKPLEVLQALIGLAADDISLARLGATLWPELDGAAAHNACHVAIHRLRKSLADESLIRIDHGMVGLNWREVWADVQEFRRLAGRIRAVLSGGRPIVSELEPLAEQLLQGYPGHFLPGEERFWAVGVREQLRSRFIHLASELSGALERAGAAEAALALNRRGIELDPLTESFHRAIMRTLLTLGRGAEALEAFHRCRTTLLAGLRIEPSAETRALHNRVRELTIRMDW